MTYSVDVPESRTVSASTTYACNPAHSYPNGQSCISTNGQLSLVTPSPSASSTYACNPAHSYPNGATCVSESGHLTLVTYSADVPECRTASSSFSAYDCNPAHSYPNGQTCTSISGTRGLVLPPATTTVDMTTYTTVTTCPVTQTSGKATVTTLTTSTVVVTSCKGGCPSTVVPHTSTVPVSAAPSLSADCQKKYDDCRSVKNPSNPPNYAECAAEYASCLGYNPFTTNTPAQSTPVQSKPNQLTTEGCHCPAVPACTNQPMGYITVTETFYNGMSSKPAVTSSMAHEITASVPNASYACNQAHSYPNGATCISQSGSLTLVTRSVDVPEYRTLSSATTTTPVICNAAAIARGDCTATAAIVPTSSVTYACNPAHSYPNGATCVSQSGSLTLVTYSVDVPEYRTESASATTTPVICNAAAIARGDCTATAAIVPTSSSTPVICNAAAIARGDCTATAAIVPTSTTTYACNPAHSYPNGASCVSTNGQLSLVTPAPSSTGYACNPAHAYPNGAECVSTNGQLSLVTPAAQATTY